MARFCLFKGPRDHIGPEHLLELSWLTIPDRVNYFKALHVHKIISGNSAGYLNGSFSLVSDVHSYRTRSVSNDELFVPRVSSAKDSSTFSVTAAQFWNSVPSTIRSLPLKNFKGTLHRYLLNK